MDGIILDFRGNGGGALEDARKMTGLFISQGPVVQVKDHSGRIEVLKDEDGKIAYNGPLMVLIGRSTASASEILAGALQDYKRAVVVGVGESSHGKGTVQAVVNLNQGVLRSLFKGKAIGALKVTIQKFYRVNGDSTQKKGIVADIKLPDPLAGYERGKEQYLDYALPWDTVVAQKYIPWKGLQYNLSSLRDRSLKRVKKSTNFKKIRKKTIYINKRKDETRVTLNEKKLLKEEDKRKKEAKKFKIEEENKNFVISDYYQALVNNSSNFSPAKKKKWKKLWITRQNNWFKELKSDVYLHEAYFIMNDVINDHKKSNLALFK